MEKVTTKNCEKSICENCEHCMKEEGRLVCLDRNWFLRFLLGLQRVPQYGWCNHFVKARQTRTR